ncbi:MAG TPA: alpha,alpha-trehalase TreF [Longimicrobiales bacterium]
MRRLALVLVWTIAATGPALSQTSAQRRPAPQHLYDPAHDLGLLFRDVQLAGVFADSKTFVDARPRLAPPEIIARYARQGSAHSFDLRGFVARYFAPPAAAGASFHSDTAMSMAQHVRAMWPVLSRAPDRLDARSSLIPLPHGYIVPGGRFREIYYWDSYFTMLGLVQSRRTDLVRDMLDNFAYLIATYGHIPNGNRSYYLSRSQPPYFGAMVALYMSATADTSGAVARYLAPLEAEYAFWMDGAARLAPGTAHRRVVCLRTGEWLNRYWDDLPEPRPESYREDVTLAQTVPADRREALYRNIRASAESGWDFSSRWMRDTSDLRSLETTQLVPVDLNALLYRTESVIASLRRYRGRDADKVAAQRFAAAAARRRSTLLAVAFDSAEGFFFDVRWRTGQRVTDRPTLAAAAPLYFGMATTDQARAVAARLARDFLKPGGFVTTLISSGQQWDAPNGWPPLQWLAMAGLQRYGLDDAAQAARERWLALNARVYHATGRMMEKYDVVNPNRPAGGGEYPAQDGFGWTNGVVLALCAQSRTAHANSAWTARPTDCF